jgi:CheY-like chemotaxis protein
VLVAAHEEAARRLIEEHAVEAAVTVSFGALPDWNGVRRLSEQLNGIPVASCVLTTRRVTARELAVTDCLLKPIGREQIRHALRKLGRPVRTILVVDDDPEMVRLMARLISLVSRRYTVWEAQSGREALTLLETKRPDAAFLDLVMPGLTGDELVGQIRARPGLESIPIVLVTGHGLENETVTAQFLGLCQNGGFNVRELMRCLRASLEVVRRPQSALGQHLEQRGAADRLGQEVGCPHGHREGPLMDHRADGDGDVPRPVVALEDFQEIPAVAQRHH